MLCNTCDAYGVVQDYKTGKVIVCPDCDGKYYTRREIRDMLGEIDL